MLQRFWVDNYKTFFYKTDVSLKSKPYGHLPDMVMDNGLLRSCMIFGANNVGKSKLIEALKLLRAYVCSNDSEEIETLLSGKIIGNWGMYASEDFCSLKKLTELGVDILIEDNGHEYLYRYVLVLKILLKKGYRICDLYSSDPKYENIEYKVISETLKLCRDNEKKPYRVVYFNEGNEIKRLINNRGNPHVKRVYDWFKNDLIIVNVGDQRPFELFNRPNHYLENLNEVIRCMDVGIDHLEWVNDAYEVVHTNGWRSDLSDESEGTRRIVDLAPALIPGYDGKTIVIDELNRKLHPDLTRRFIELFVLEQEEKKQLIFTTHETRLLDDWLFRRDEILFVREKKTYPEDRAKVVCQSSECIPLSDPNGRSLWEEYIGAITDSTQDMGGIE